MSNQQGSQSSPGIEDINPNINLDFEEHSPFQEGVMPKTFQRLDKSFLQECKELGDLINKGNLIQKDIDKILKVIQRKVLKKTHLPVDIKEIQARYLHSSYFKDIFLYLSQNKLPSSKAAIKKGRSSKQAIHPTRLSIVPNYTRKGGSSPCNSRNMCG